MVSKGFESLVSFEGCKTQNVEEASATMFESLVSFEGCKTYKGSCQSDKQFESLVSFEGCKTQDHRLNTRNGLRVL